MASKKEVKKAAMTPEEKAARKKARQEALKNRPEEQRPNGKQVDVIQVSETSSVKKYAAPIKLHNRSIGCLITSVAVEGDKVTAISETFVPGNIVPKVKKGHGTLVAQKDPKDKKKKKSSDSSAED